MQLYDLYVIYRDGQALFHKRYEWVIDQEIRVTGQDIITAFLTAIENHRNELLGSEFPRVFEKGPFKLLLTYGKDICGALLCRTDNKEETLRLRHILEQIVGDIQVQYADILPTWRGNMRQLARISDIVGQNLKEIIPPLPSLLTFIQDPNRYFFTIDERGINLYNRCLRNAEGFHDFITKLQIPVEMVDTVLNGIRSARKTSAQLSEALHLEVHRVTTLLRALTLRGIVNLQIK
jgi:hypothetical protein